MEALWLLSPLRGFGAFDRPPSRRLRLRLHAAAAFAAGRFEGRIFVASRESSNTLLLHSPLTIAAAQLPFPGGDDLSQAKEWLGRLRGSLQVADAPHVR